jgi:hypothetical protein
MCLSTSRKCVSSAMPCGSPRGELIVPCRYAGSQRLGRVVVVSENSWWGAILQPYCERWETRPPPAKKISLKEGLEGVAWTHGIVTP